MILTCDDVPLEKAIWVVDPKTPYSSEDCGKMCDLIEGPRFRVFINAAYSMMVQAAENGHPSGRAGWNMKFWFIDYDEAVEFAAIYSVPVERQEY